MTSEGKRAFCFSIGLDKFLLEAEQGIVGGIIRLKKVQTTGRLNHSSFIGLLRQDVFDVLTDSIDVRLDYMGSPSLMDRPVVRPTNDSTTPDMIKMSMKLTEYFNAQFAN